MLEKIRKILQNYIEIDEEDMKSEASLLGDLGMNSLDVLNTVTDLEEEFGISVADEDIHKLVTIGDVIEYVENKRA